MNDSIGSSCFRPSPEIELFLDADMLYHVTAEEYRGTHALAGYRLPCASILMAWFEGRIEKHG